MAKDKTFDAPIITKNDRSLKLSQLQTFLFKKNHFIILSHFNSNEEPQSKT